MMTYIFWSGVFVMLAAVLTWFIGRIVTEDARWGTPWVWIVFGIGFAVSWIAIIV